MILAYPSTLTEGFILRDDVVYHPSMHAPVRDTEMRDVSDVRDVSGVVARDVRNMWGTCGGKLKILNVFFAIR